MTAITHKSDETDGRRESFNFAPPKAQPTRTRARGVTDLLVASSAQSNHHALGWTTKTRTGADRRKTQKMPNCFRLTSKD